MNLPDTIDVTYKVASTTYKAAPLLKEISKYPVIAADFETTTIYSPKQREEWKLLLASGTLSKLEAVDLLSKLRATALDHPSHIRLTHCSIATSESEAYVFILDNKAITDYVLHYLTSSKQKIIFHNYSYDGRIIHYLTGKYLYDLEDTQILAKTLLNHVEVHKANTGLKHLAGHVYGSWGISSDNFDIAHMYDEKVLKYASTDACATYHLWSYLNSVCDRLDVEQIADWSN
jgi:hypothetical protein